MPKKGSLVEETLSWASSPGVRQSMVGNKSRDTKPELMVRRYLHASGLRYRVHARPIKEWNRRADIVFSKAKVAVFVNGCFWHGCAKHYIEPKTNVDYWFPKIARNVERDAETFARLRSEKWLVIVIWEHEDLEARAAKAVLRIKKRIHSSQKSPNISNSK